MKLEQLGYGPERVPKPIGLTATMAFIAGGLLVVWSTYIHFHLWRNLGYRPIPTIGTLFLVQSIAGLLVGLLIIFVCRVWVAIVGVGFALSTMIGFLASINYGLFGFKDSWSAPFAHQAFAIEIATVIILTIAGALCLTRSAESRASMSRI
jgi:hypothetical protein